MAFWCYCSVFESGDYKNLNPNEVPIYEKFIDIHDDIMNMQDSIPFPITIFEVVLFSFFKEFYENNMDAGEAYAKLDYLREGTIKEIDNLVSQRNPMKDN